MSAVTNFDAESELDAGQEHLLWLLVDYNALCASSSLQPAFESSSGNGRAFDASSMMDFGLDLQVHSDYSSATAEGQIHQFPVLDLGGKYAF